MPDIIQSCGSYKYGTNQAMNEVLYDGSTPTSIEFASSLMTFNMGLPHLLIPKVLQLQEQSKPVLVLSMTSHLLPLFKGVVLQDIRQNYRSLCPTLSLQLANKTMEKRHEFKPLGKPYIDFFACILSYPKRHLLYDDAIDAATLHLWLAQGEGFKVKFLDYPGQTLLVKWKNLQDVTALEIWRPSTHDTNYLQFFWLSLLDRVRLNLKSTFSSQGPTNAPQPMTWCSNKE
jgi:hypothetical protein